jgi:CheY-like chemotaxis protein
MASLLIVDDNEGLRESMSTYFEGQGHHLETADGVQQALQQVRRRAPDLVLSDQVMEDGTGLGLHDGIRRLGLPKDPYFILLTGHPTLDNASEAYRRGVDLYLTKPFQLPALALAVGTALRQLAPAAGPEAGLRAQAGQAYHELFLAMNPLMPRLLLLLEGRYGSLDADQLACVSAVFDIWRRLAWAMTDFHRRVQDPGPAGLTRGPWHGPAALRRILERLEPDLAMARLATDLRLEPRLASAWVHGPTAESMLEACLLRLAAFSAPGASLSLAWEQGPRSLRLTLRSDLAHPDLTGQMMRNAGLLPALAPLLAEAGLELSLSDDCGPWSLGFRLR